MTTVYAGPDGSFWTGWQLARATGAPIGWRWVLSSDGNHLLETPAGEPYLCLAIDEHELPAGVTVDGFVIRDRREEQGPTAIEPGESKR